MSLVLNVIYTPHTAKRLSIFAWSLLRWPTVDLRLVANACTPDEQRHLQAFCAHDRRLAYLELPTDQVWRHGRVLDYLLLETHEECFGFIDSDIFVVGAHDSPTLPEDYSAAFACPLPAWWRVRHPQRVGCTVFAIYRRDVIAALSQSTGIGFNKHAWAQLPPNIQQEVERAGFRLPKYDTGQVLNILLVARKHRIGSLPSSYLRHLGQNSNVTLSLNHATPSVGPETASLFFDQGSRRLLCWIWNCIQRGYGSVSRQKALRRQRKQWANIYFNEMLDALLSGRPVPAIPRYFPRQLRAEVKAMTTDVTALHAEYSCSPFHESTDL